MPEPIELKTADGVTLEAELSIPAEPPRCGVVLCHPHPQYGGTMRSIVISALFDALPAQGVACLRFNFRGVEGSEGMHDFGNLERVDAETAVAALKDQLSPAIPLILTGWSFGADMALSVRDARVDAWLAIAPPLVVVHDVDGLAADPRPKLLALAQHDEYRDPAEVTEIAERWANADVLVVGGASHFFMGRTDRLIEVAGGFVDRLAPVSS
ncbi:MAG TPA: alpha/beta hydrolase [Acidimicrobiia bacterium]|nr:alpha/beta hydrolase [Acidimicrobiia bacterium]